MLCSPLIRHDVYPAAGRRGKNNEENHLDSFGRPLAIMCVSVSPRLVPIGIVRGVPGYGYHYPQPGPLSYTSTVCSAVHIPLLPPLLLLSRLGLSFRWLSAPSNFLSHLRHGLRLMAPAANALLPFTIHFNLRSTATDPLPIFLIDRPLDPHLFSIRPRLVVYSRFVSRRFSFITDCSLRRCATTSARIRPQTIQTLYLDPVTRQPTSTLVRPTFRTGRRSRALCLWSTVLHPPPTILMPNRSRSRSFSASRESGLSLLPRTRALTDR